MDSGTHDLLRTSLSALLSEPAADAERPLADRLDELGWAEVVADDRVAAHDLLFRAVGETRARGDALSLVLTDTLAVTAVADSLGADELRRATVVLPGSLHPDHLTSRVEGSSLDVRGIVLGVPVAGATLCVPALGPDGVEVALVVAPNDAAIERVHGVDPELGVGRVAFSVPLADVRHSQGAAAADGWSRAVVAGRRGLAAALVAMGHHCVRQVVSYTADRKQYGRSIASFQAVQHRLADAHAGLVGADGLVGECLTAASDDPWIAAVAKCAAGRAFEEASRQVQQCYGAIGFTWEHEFPGYLRRGYLFDQLLGDWRTLEVEIGSALWATRTVPRIGAL